MIKDGKYTNHIFRFDIVVETADNSTENYMPLTEDQIGRLGSYFLCNFGIFNAKVVRINKLQI